MPPGSTTQSLASRAGETYTSPVGKKAVMAVTGVILFGWIFAHMVGNLKLYLGPEHMNEYAKFHGFQPVLALPEMAVLFFGSQPRTLTSFTCEATVRRGWNSSMLLP